ncbi:MAG TPA: hypothetical protein PKA05_10410, partial [Roseiflexaceae bacterium]|nr:hypothetical protein [Roseiflexaceae bacterium]
MTSPSHARNLLITALVMLLIVMIGTQAFPAVAAPLPAPAKQAVDFSWSPVSGSVTISPGGAPGQFNTTLFNRDTATRSYTVSTTGLPAGWNFIIAPASSVSIGGSGSLAFSFFISAPNGTPAETRTVEIIATRTDNSATSLAVLTVTVASPTATPTNTVPPTATISPTPTVGSGCPDTELPGNDFGSARLVLVDLPENHGICAQGEEDWYKFGAVGGKVYTIDIERMESGLDLSLELYDANRQRLTFNDDFFLRDPANPNPRDIRPRIQSWRAPRDGIYYVRVRDTLNLGGRNKTYTFVVRSESYGPTPAPISELCRDLFEEDGLPEQAKLITSNELQQNRSLCPTGDADWVTFFGKAGKTYYLYTDTRPYKNNPDINPETLAGADTVLYLVDRDGITLLDFNDDIEGSLDSQIRFVPRVDGFYYAQIKNTGDIGNQFIRYDLILQLCLPDVECGRAPQPAIGPPPPGGSTGTEPPSDAPAAEPPATDATPSPAPFIDITTTPTLQSFVVQDNVAAPGLIDGMLVGFADRSFETVWRRTDRVIAEGRTSRSWIWGPRGLMARAEGYVQMPGGMRQVQYFDKGRMEINNPGGDRNSPWFVTSGLLVVELISGRMQIGEREFVQRDAAQVVIAGDITDFNAPTHASSAQVGGRASADRSGEIPRETLSRNGLVGVYGGPSRSETRLVRYVSESGHNIPAVFWEYLNTRGPIYNG